MEFLAVLAPIVIFVLVAALLADRLGAGAREELRRRREAARRGRGRHRASKPH